jgi:ATP-dependent exoDNAse (exonuclease V) beta subunit
MQDLQRDFHVEKVIKLEQNYRSHGNILDAANALIGHNRKRLGKNLWTDDAKGEPLRVFEAASDFEEEPKPDPLELPAAAPKASNASNGGTRKSSPTAPPKPACCPSPKPRSSAR